MPPSRKAAAAAVALLLVLAFTAFRPAGTPGPLERDLEAYYAAGATVDAGGDPYSRAIWAAERGVPGVDAAREELLPFVGPAAALPWWSLLARLPYPGAVAVWTAVLAAALGAIVIAALRIARPRRDPWRSALALAFAVASAPALAALALGQTALVGAGAVAAATVAYARRRAGAAFGATLIAALQPNLAVALIARLRSRWDGTVAAAAALAFAGLTLAVGGGVIGALTYLGRLAAHGRAERDIAIQYTPAAVAYALGLPPAAAGTAGAIIAVTAAAAAAVVIARERLDPIGGTLLACAALPLAAPFFHEPDFALTVFPLLVLALRARGRARALGAVAAALLLVDWFGLAQRHGAQGQILCLGLAVCVAFAGLSPAGPGRADAAGLAAFVALAALGLPFAGAHPAPTWPDMLPAHFRGAPTADVSAVWGDEQRAAGLARRDAVWGLLRCLPLAGCIVLGAAVVADARRRRTGRERAAPAGPGRRLAHSGFAGVSAQARAAARPSSAIGIGDGD